MEWSERESENERSWFGLNIGKYCQRRCNEIIFVASAAVAAAFACCLFTAAKCIQCCTC